MIRLRVPGSLTYRHLAVRVVAAACKMAEPQRVESAPSAPAGDFEAQTVSAFGEAFNNVAIHGYRDRPPGDVDIEIESDEDGIVIQMMDTGQSFDPSTIAEPRMEDLPESGMGLFIIHSFMDEVDYRPGNPNVLRLVKRRGLGDGGEGRSEADGGEGVGAGQGSACAGPHSAKAALDAAAARTLKGKVDADPRAMSTGTATADPRQVSREPRAAARSGVRIRSVSQGRAARAAGGIKGQ